jgi:vacuolar-type H+-ATPase subunit E/Vma4
MSEDTLIKKIADEAAASAAAIKAEADTEVAAIEAQTKTLLQEAAAAHEALVTKEKTHLETVAFSKARQTASIAVQSAKRAGVDEVFKKAAEAIAEAPADEYVSFFTKSVQAIVPEKIEGTVRCPVKREEETKQLLKTASVEGTISVDPTITAGFVMETADGVYDVTLNRILADRRPELEMEVIKQTL